MCERMAGQSPHIGIAMVAHDKNNNANRLTATVAYKPNQIIGSLDQLIVELPDGTWHLAQPTQFTKDEHHIKVEHFALVNGVRHVTLDASIAPAHAQKIALRARAIDLAVLRPLLPQGQQVAGDLSAEIMISGTSIAPLIKANLSINELVMNSQRLGDVNATTDYKPSTAALDVTLHQDHNHQLRVSGDIPASLKLGPRLRRDDRQQSKNSSVQLRDTAYAVWRGCTNNAEKRRRPVAGRSRTNWTTAPSRD